MRTLNKVEGAVTRREILTEDVEMHSKNNLKRVVEKGKVLDSVYLYEVVPSTPRSDLTEQEVVDFENIIIMMFVKYGQKCADEKFLLSKVQQEYPEYKVDYLYVFKVDKFYKGTLRRGRMQEVPMASKITSLNLKNENTNNI